MNRSGPGFHLVADLEIRGEFRAAGWAGHEHSADILRKTQLLPAFGARFDDIVRHVLSILYSCGNEQNSSGSPQHHTIHAIVTISQPSFCKDV